MSAFHFDFSFNIKTITKNCENCLLCEEYFNNAINTLSVKLLYHRKVISLSIVTFSLKS